MIVEFNLAFNVTAEGAYVEIKKSKEHSIRQEILKQMNQIFKDVESYPSISGLDISFHSLNLVAVVEETKPVGRDGGGAW